MLQICKLIWAAQMGVSKYNRNLVNRAQDATFISQPLSLSLSLSLSLLLSLSQADKTNSNHLLLSR